MPLKAEIFSSIRDVPREQWNGLLKNHSATHSCEFWDVIETSQLNDFSYRYVLLSDDAGAPVALASFYSITTDLAIFASGAFKRLLVFIRRPFPNFLKLRMLECGTPITLNSPAFV